MNGLIPRRTMRLMLWRCLRYPRMQIYAFDGRPSVRSDLERRTWGWLALLAVAGTLLYGASLSLVAPGPRALQLLAAAGTSWCLFGPSLVLLTRRRIATCAHACLVTMVYGVGILAIGAAANLILQPGLAFNIAWITLSNVAMAAALVRQLSVLGVRWWRTLTAWTIVLDGAGLLLFRGVGGLS